MAETTSTQAPAPAPAPATSLYGLLEARIAALESEAKTWYEKHVTVIAAGLSAATALLAGHIFWR